MFTLFKKKKLSENQIANYFVRTLIQMTEDGFRDVSMIINEDPEFAQKPKIQADASDQFLLIVIAGNLQMMSKEFDAVRSARISDKVMKRFGEIYSIDPIRVKETIAKLQSWMSQINHPSKNTHYAMSKAVFYKYGLNEFQTEYFRNMKTPNPILLKRLDDITGAYILKWDSIKEDFRIVE